MDIGGWGEIGWGERLLRDNTKHCFTPGSTPQKTIQQNQAYVGNETTHTHTSPQHNPTPGSTPHRQKDGQQHNTVSPGQHAKERDGDTQAQTQTHATHTNTCSLGQKTCERPHVLWAKKQHHHTQGTPRNHYFWLVLLWFRVGVAVGSRWIPKGFALVARWLCFGFAVVRLRFRVIVAFALVSFWLHNHSSSATSGNFVRQPTASRTPPRHRHQQFLQISKQPFETPKFVS